MSSTELRRQDDNHLRFYRGLLARSAVWYCNVFLKEDFRGNVSIAPNGGLVKKYNLSCDSRFSIYDREAVQCNGYDSLASDYQLIVVCSDDYFLDIRSELFSRRIDCQRILHYESLVTSFENRGRIEFLLNLPFPFVDFGLFSYWLGDDSKVFFRDVFQLADYQFIAGGFREGIPSGAGQVSVCEIELYWGEVSKIIKSDLRDLGYKKEVVLVPEDVYMLSQLYINELLQSFFSGGRNTVLVNMYKRFMASKG